MNTNKKLIISILALLAIGAVFVTMPLYRITGEMNLSETLSLFNYDGMRFLSPITILMYIGSILCISIPFALKKEMRPIGLLPAKLASFWTLLFFLLIWCFAADQVRKYKNMTSLSLTIPGWIVLITTISTIVFALILSYKLKKTVK